MKTYIATISDHNGFDLFEGKGASMDEAKKDLLSKVEESIEYDVEEDGLRLPLAETAPATLPKGCVLVVFVRCSHNDGLAYDYRYAAIPKGGTIVDPFAGLTNKIEERRSISFLDCNADYRFELPNGSYEHKDGDWTSVQKVEYNY